MIFLTVAGLDSCEGTRQDLQRFVSVIRFAARIEAKYRTDAKLKSSMVAKEFNLSPDDRVHLLVRVGHMLGLEPWGGGPVNFTGHEWEVSINHPVRDFEDADNPEEYWARRPPATIGGLENTMAEPITIFIVHGHDEAVKYRVAPPLPGLNGGVPAQGNRNVES